MVYTNDNETFAARLEALKSLLLTTNTIPLEALNTDLFPRSVANPAWWSGASAGAKLAAALDARVSFSRKTLTVTFVPFDDFSRSKFEARLNTSRARDRERARNTYAQLMQVFNSNGESK